MLAGRSVARFLRRALPALPLLALAGGCGDDDAGEAQEADDRVIVKVAFDDFAYVDAASSTRKLIERVRQENESIFSTLRRADVTITAKKQVDVDLGHLEKDPVTVVDPSTGITRSALRLRYHFVALALAPRALVATGDLRMGALHAPSSASMEAVVATCTPNGDRERSAVAEPWTVFDGRIDRCVSAVLSEQAAIDAARKRLAQPTKEIVSAEFERLYVPVTVRVRERPSKAADPAPRQPAEGQAPAARGPSEPAQAQQPDGSEPARRWVDRAAERDAEDAEDERVLQRMARPAGGGQSQSGTASWGTSPYLAPNFTLLYVVVGALVFVIIGWRRQEQKRRP